MGAKKPKPKTVLPDPPFTLVELANRLFRFRQYWFDGPPTAQVFGVEGEFGSIVFTFPNNGGVLTIRCLMRNIPRIQAMSHEVIKNFRKILSDETERVYGN